MKTIEPAELHQLLAQRPDLALLDVRTLVEFAEAHVPQASNIPLNRSGAAETGRIRPSFEESTGFCALAAPGCVPKGGGDTHKGRFLRGDRRGRRHTGLGRCRLAP